ALGEPRCAESDRAGGLAGEEGPIGPVNDLQGYKDPNASGADGSCAGEMKDAPEVRCSAVAVSWAGRLAASEKEADYTERDADAGRRAEVDPLNPLLADKVLKRRQRQSLDLLGTCSAVREDRNHERTDTTND